MGENQRLPYSLDEDFDELEDKDKTVELVGYICCVEAPIKVKNYDLFKFGLSNGGSKKIMCLVWKKALIDTLQPHIVPNKIIHIDGAHCKASKFPKILEQSSFLNLEIIIQESTIINYLGMHETIQDIPLAMPPREVDFETIIDVEGKITIDGFVKMEFAAIPSRYQDATYGCGSITNGFFKITVNIANYQPLNFTKGTAVTVTGDVNFSSGLLTINCSNSSMVIQRAGIESLKEQQLLRGTRIHKRRHP